MHKGLIGSIESCVVALGAKEARHGDAQRVDRAAYDGTKRQRGEAW